MFNALLVDDEPVAVNALKNRVDWKKYGVDEVFTAGSMEQAETIFKTKRVDFMLSDVEMPQGSGIELFEWVKSYYPKVECIYVTCHPEYDYMRDALRLGSADYLLKPIDYEELDNVLVKLVKRLQATKVIRQAPQEIVRHMVEEELQKSYCSPVDGARKYILIHIQESMSIDDIAQEVHLNPQYLMRLFKKETGYSILEYITDERIRMAKELLLKTEYPVNQVADTVGYANYSYFTKIFRRSVGVSPKKFRENGGAGQAV